MKALNLRAWRKIDAAIGNQINLGRHDFQGNISVSHYEQNVGEAISTLSAERKAHLPRVLRLIQVRTAIRNAIGVANATNGIDDLISRKKELFDTRAAILWLIERIDETAPADTQRYFSEKKAKSDAGHVVSSRFGGLQSIDIPVYTAEEKKDLALQAKQLTSEINRIEDTLAAKNLSVVIEIINDDDYKLLEDLGLV